MVIPPKRIWTRRRLVAGSAAAGGAGVVAAGFWLRGSDGEDRGGAPISPTRAPTSMPPTPAPTSRPVGGVPRISAAARLNFDTFDALRTVERSVEEVLGRTHSRVVQWTPGNGEIEADLGAEWEQVDELTLRVRRNERAVWQARGAIQGRPLLSEDIGRHFARLLDLRAAGQLSGALSREFARLARVSVPGDGSILFETDKPDPLFPAALASRFALVQSPEAADVFASTWHQQEPESVVGTGPFVFDGFINGWLSFRAHIGAHRPAFVEGLRIGQPHGVGAAARARFAARELDVFLARDRRDVEALETEPRVSRERRFEENATISTVFAGAPPWSNLNLLRAVSVALNRPELVRRLHGALAVPSGPVAPVYDGFGVPERELISKAGYRSDFAVDIADARALWSAGGGEGLGAVTVDFPSTYDPLYSASSVVCGLLNEALGVSQFVPAVHQYTVISAKAVAFEYGSGRPALWFGWGPPFESPDPTRYLIETFRTGAAGWAPQGMTVPGLDGVLDRLAAAFEFEERQALAREADGLLLDAGGAGVFPWLVQTGERFRRDYLELAPPTPFWGAAWDSGMTMDVEAAAADGRPA
ncbi:MAG TPA: ABC transporter substrate-binding protein [Tepidiformaceae bacterium]|nr:ABC transporter substrate-binding protein [Tepidiformaceae bacterium]